MCFSVNQCQNHASAFFIIVYIHINTVPLADITLLLLCSEMAECQKNLSVISVKIQKDQILNMIMIKFDVFFHMILKDIDLAVSFKNIMLNIFQYFIKLIARPISFCIMLKPSNLLSKEGVLVKQALWYLIWHH